MSFQRKVFLWAGIAATVCVFIWLFVTLRSPKTTGNPGQTPMYADRGNNTGISAQEPAGSTDVSQFSKPPSSKQPATEQGVRDATGSRPAEEKLPSDRLITGHAAPDASSTSRPAVENPIESIIVEEKVTFETRKRAPSPPDEVPFAAPYASAYLEGPESFIRLDFVSPVGFKMQDDGRVVVINRFSLQQSSAWYLQPVEILANCDAINLPVVTAYYGSSLQSIVSLEASLAVNGQDVWKYRLDSKLRFPQSAPIRIQLGGALNQMFGGR